MWEKATTRPSILMSMKMKMARSSPASTNMASTVAADARASQRICEPGYFCENGVRRPCPAGHYGSDRGLSARTCNGKCPPGMWCAERAYSSITDEERQLLRDGGLHDGGGRRALRTRLLLPPRVV